MFASFDVKVFCRSVTDVKQCTVTATFRGKLQFPVPVRLL